MNDNKKQLWSNALHNISEKHTAEAAETLYKRSLNDFESDELIVVETDKQKEFKRKAPVFSVAAAIIAVIGVGTVTALILSNSGIFTTPLSSDTNSGISSADSDISPEVLTNGNYNYIVLSDNTIEITRYTGNDKEVVIPEKIDEKKVTAIGEGAFADCDRIEEISLPYTLLKIKADAFVNCSMLKELSLPISITYIGDNAIDKNVKLYCSENSFADRKSVV